MNAVVPLSEDILSEAFSKYDIGTLQRSWPASNGIENSNYFIQSLINGRRCEYVLTVMEQPANSGQAYVSMMDALDQYGLPVAAPIRSISNEAVETISDKPALLQPRLSGQHTFSPTIKQICSLARFIARMHLTMQASAVELPAYPRDPSWLQANADRVLRHIPYTDQALLNDAITKTKSLLSRKDVRMLPQGMIHGDLFRDNVLFNERGLTGVLDFHHAASGFWIYDLAVVANDWCSDAEGQLNPDRTTAMLKAYHSIRPLKEQEVWFFSSFAMYAAISFWLSRLTVTLSRLSSQKDNQQRTGQVRFKNPDEFRQIVKQNARHSFYLDPRILQT